MISHSILINVFIFGLAFTPPNIEIASRIIYLFYHPKVELLESVLAFLPKSMIGRVHIYLPKIIPFFCSMLTP